MPNLSVFPSLPHSWSDLTWQQLNDCWKIKMRYGGNPDVARVAVLLSLLGCSVGGDAVESDKTTGEARYVIATADSRHFIVTPREASQMARQALTWFDYPYGDQGEKEVKDDAGKVVKEAREAVMGYVSHFRDAMVLPLTEVTVDGFVFALPQVACNNLTWQQYRSLQSITPQIFKEGQTDEQVLNLQANFLSHILVPAKQNEMNDDRFRPKRSFHYDLDRAEHSISFWKSALHRESKILAMPKWQRSLRKGTKAQENCAVLFNICFQTYQTAIIYYERIYPLLFGEEKNDPLRDALQGEVGTINTVMKYAGYSSQEQVYDSNLPFILDILNTMTKEAKEMERINAKIKKK